MKDIGFVVMLSDNLERYRYVEPCEFVEILGAKTAILSTWRHMLVRTACVVVSLEESNMSREQVGGLLNAIRSDAAATLRRNRLWKPLQTYVVLGCNSELYDQLTPFVTTLADRGRLHINRIAKVSLFDRVGLRVAHGDKMSLTLGTSLSSVSNLMTQWVTGQRQLNEQHLSS